MKVSGVFSKDLEISLSLKLAKSITITLFQAEQLLNPTVFLIPGEVQCADVRISTPECRLFTCHIDIPFRPKDSSICVSSQDMLHIVTG